MASSLLQNNIDCLCKSIHNAHTACGHCNGNFEGSSVLLFFLVPICVILPLFPLQVSCELVLFKLFLISLWVFSELSVLQRIWRLHMLFLCAGPRVISGQ
jgi:hypothetical protein